MVAVSALAVNLDILERFASFADQGRMAHAYLFTGPRLSGKTTTAVVAAKLINDEITLEDIRRGIPEDYVETVTAHHPDIRLIATPNFESIKIEVVKELLQQVRLRPFQARTKVFIIQNADMLTSEGANALLKTLEEPAANSLLILTTAASENVLSTIRSRCQEVVFVAQSQATIAATLRDSLDVFNEQEISFLANFSEGCLGRARDLHKQDAFRQKNELLDTFFRASSGGDFIKKLTADKCKTEFFLAVLLSWVRDAMLCKCGQGQQNLVHQDRFGEIEQFARKTCWKDLWELYRQLARAGRYLAENLNIKIPLMIIKEQLYGTIG